MLMPVHYIQEREKIFAPYVDAVRKFANESIHWFSSYKPNQSTVSAVDSSPKTKTNEIMKTVAVLLHFFNKIWKNKHEFSYIVHLCLFIEFIIKAN